MRREGGGGPSVGRGSTQSAGRPAATHASAAAAHAAGVATAATSEQQAAQRWKASPSVRWVRGALRGGAVCVILNWRQPQEELLAMARLAACAHLCAAPPFEAAARHVAARLVRQRQRLLDQLETLKGGKPAGTFAAMVALAEAMDVDPAYPGKDHLAAFMQLMGACDVQDDEDGDVFISAVQRYCVSCRSGSPE